MTKGNMDQPPLPSHTTGHTDHVSGGSWNELHFLLWFGPGLVAVLGLKVVFEAVSKVKLNQDNRGGSAVSHDGWP